MKFEDLIPEKISVGNFGDLTLKKKKSEGNFTIFEFFNRNNQKVDIGNEIEYLVLYSSKNSKK